MDWFFIITSLAKIIGLIFAVILPMVAYSTYAERRFSAILQDRVGPNRVGIPLTLLGFAKDWSFAGLVQPAADGVKNFLKEDFTPDHVNKFYFILAPALTLITAFLTCAVLPFSSEINLPIGNQEGGRTIPMVIADLNVGPLFVFALASLSVYGIVLAGWSSNSKYPFFGGVRSSSQMISYEIAMGLSIIPVLLILGELNLGRMVTDQSENGWLLLPFSFTAEAGMFQLDRIILWVPLLISFIIFTTSVFAETNRLPFDLPECETELVAGYHTEYSSMKFAMFFMGEYAAMIIGSGIVVTVFLGGWSLPFGLSELLPKEGWASIFSAVIHFLTFIVKVIGFIIFFIWVRWTLPRFRYDQLMKLGWVFFFEIALVNVLLTAGILVFLGSRN